MGRGSGRWGERGEVAEITFELFLCGGGRTLQGLATYQATDTIAEVLIAVVEKVQACRGQFQAERIDVVEAVRRPTPIVADRAATERGRALEVAGVKEIIGEGSKTATPNAT